MATVSESVLLDIILSTCETTPDFISFVHNICYTEWTSVISCASKGHENHFKILQGVLKILGKHLKPTQLSKDLEEKLCKILLPLLSGNDFCSSLSQLVLSMSGCDDQTSISQLLCVLDNILLICSTVLQKLPYSGKDSLPNLIHTCIGTIYANKSLQNDYGLRLLAEFHDQQTVVQNITETFLVKEISKSRKEFSQALEDHMHGMVPPEDFRNIPLLPAEEELLQQQPPFLRPNKTRGAYTNVEHYLDVHYMLLREDLLHNLKKTVIQVYKHREKFMQAVLANKCVRQQVNGINVYSDVRLVQREISEFDSTVHYVFSISANIDWSKSKRLMPGTLVLLSSDFCKSSFFATTVAAPLDPKKYNRVNNQMDVTRSELQQGKLRLFIEQGQLPKYRTNYLMLECDAFFEAYRFVLQILKSEDMLRIFRTTLGKLLLGASGPVKFPRYLLNSVNENYKIPISDCTVNPLKPNSWPKELIQTAMKINTDQYTALQLAITSELAIVQGPPGTGKTFIGLQIFKTLHANKLSTDDKRQPILILCFTNHALDQFLELLYTKIPYLSIVRAGSQSKSEKVKKYLLPNYRRVYKHRYRKLFPRKFKQEHENYYFEDYFSTSMLSDENFRRLIDRLFSSKMLRGSITKARNQGYAMYTMKTYQAQYKILDILVQELSQPDGIVCFQNLPISELLSKIMPDRLWVQFQNLEFLGILKEAFKNKSCNPREIVNSLFGLNIKPGKTQINFVKHFFGNKLEDDNFSLNAVLEAKETAKLSPKITKASNFYFENFSKKAMAADLFRLVKAFQLHFYLFMESEKEKTVGLTNPHFDSMPEGLKHQFHHIKSKCFELENRAKWLEYLLRQHRNEKLELPFIDNMVDAEAGADFGEYDYKIRAPEIMLEPLKVRWAIYFKILDIGLHIAKREKERVKILFEMAKEEYFVEQQQFDGYILGACDVIGMTTSGAAKMHELLEIAKPKVVMVEEAAEVLEAHVLTSLTKHCQHLILIGDHLQLRPTCNVYELGTKYKLNISLFERLIGNGIPLCTLRIQHRMRPEISDLVVGTIYPELYDHESVQKFPCIKGVKKNMFFVNHGHFETTNEESMSKANLHEARFMIAFCYYLWKQGYLLDKITILTTYSGQVLLLEKLMPDAISDVKIATVDNYQGEENDIILLSLVRSNENNYVGFVGIDNRICVALSRAKHGLYVIGNINGLTKASETWKKIYFKLFEKGNIGNFLRLQCQRHSIITCVQNEQDFLPLLRSGGCANICGYELKCGHLCQQICHVENPEHEDIFCTRRCLKTCSFNHQCYSPCYTECPPCAELVKKKLKCGHIVGVPCHLEPENFNCPVKVERTMPCKFSHKVELACHSDIFMEPCPAIIEKILNCGHPQHVKCGHSEDFISCQQIVNKTLSCGHVVKRVKCGRPEKLIRCSFKVDKLLKCKHIQKVNCGTPEEFARCLTKVTVQMANCLHMESVLCCNTYSHKCKSKCEQVLGCGHFCRLTCHLDKDPNHTEYKCKEHCIRKCENNHGCRYLHKCYTKCSPCAESMKTLLKCGHEIEFECGDKSRKQIKCQHETIKMLPCGHQQILMCQDIPENQECSSRIANCERICNFGHQCLKEHLCSESCPECTERREVDLECGHCMSIYCCEDEKNLKCQEKVWVKCNHCNVGKNVKCNRKNSFSCDSCGNLATHGIPFENGKEEKPAKSKTKSRKRNKKHKKGK